MKISYSDAGIITLVLGYGFSTADEKNLLLEIDHIKPLSKGGITAEDNLQTLCWKCNRTKGAKIEV